MAAIIAHWDPTTGALTLANCGHVEPILLREDDTTEHLSFAPTHGLGGRATPKPAEFKKRLRAGDRLLLVSDGVIGSGEGQTGLGQERLIQAARRSSRTSAAAMVRAVHNAVLSIPGGPLRDDATAVCLSIG
jgi:serine phosphatase RsbU (regulator of sigma subunit)